MDKLECFESVFLRCVDVESLKEDQGLREVVDELEEYLRKQPICAYHCTREPAPGYFKQQGLRLTNLKAHQDEFLATFGHYFTASEVVELREAWDRHFVAGKQVKHREGMIWFCLTKETANSSGTDSFFKFFGGEAIFMPLKRHPTIADKLAKLGAPVVVSVRLLAGTSTPHRSLAMPLVSAYHRTLRPDAQPWPAETYIRQPVDSHDVLAVTKAS